MAANRNRPKTFDDGAQRALVTQARAVADYSYEHNKIDHAERYADLADALEQAIRERDEARAALTT